MLPSLKINIGANTQAAIKGLENVRRRLAAVGETSQKARQDLTRFSKAATGIAAALKGVTVVAAGAAVEIQRFARVSRATTTEFQNLAAGAQRFGISQEKLADQLKDFNERIGDFAATGAGPMLDFFEQIGPKVGVTIEDFQRLSGPEALQLYVNSLQQAGVNQQQMSFFLESMASDLTQLIPLLSNNGAAVDKFASRARQLGAVMSEETIANLTRLRASLADNQLAMVGLRNEIADKVAPAMLALSEAFSNALLVGQPLREALSLLIDNLDRLAVYAATAAGFLAGRYVTAFAAAAIATAELSAALGVLRGALIRTGFGAIVVGVGELIFQFTQLVQKTASVGDAFQLVKNVALEATGRIGVGFKSLSVKISAFYQNIISGANTSMQKVSDAFFAAVNDITNAFQGMGAAVSVVFQNVVAAASNAARGAANAVIGGVEFAVNKAVEGLNSLLSTTRSALSKIPGLGSVLPEMQVGKVSLGKFDTNIEGASQTVAEAFSSAFDEDAFVAPKVFENSANLAKGLSAEFSRLADEASESFSAPLESLEALRAAMAKTSEETSEQVEKTSASNIKLSAGLQAVSSGAEEASSATEQAGEAAKSAGTKVEAAGQAAEKAKNPFEALAGAMQSLKNRLDVKAATEGFISSLSDAAIKTKSVFELVTLGVRQQMAKNSELLKNAGSQFVSQLVSGIQSRKEELAQAKDAFEALSNAMETLKTRLDVKAATDSFVSSLSEAAITAKSVSDLVTQGVTQQMAQNSELLKNAGGEFVRQLASGIEARKEELAKQLESAIERSKDLLWKITEQEAFAGPGRQIVEGLRLGIKSETASLQESMTSLAGIMESSLLSGFDKLIDGTLNFRQAFAEMVNSLIKEAFRLFVIEAVLGQIKSALGGFGYFGFGGAAKITPTAVYEGGGYTGKGARSGGVDGRGGFPAILHPNETVIDHTKGGSVGGVTVVQHNHFASGVTRNEVTSLLPKIIQATKASILDSQQRSVTGRAFI